MAVSDLREDISSTVTSSRPFGSVAGRTLLANSTIRRYRVCGIWRWLSFPARCFMGLSIYMGLNLIIIRYVEAGRQQQQRHSTAEAQKGQENLGEGRGEKGGVCDAEERRRENWR